MEAARPAPLRFQGMPHTIQVVSVLVSQMHQSVLV